MALYLVTGIAGFIGSSLARELIRRGETVRGIDNFSTGKKENLASFRHQIDFREVDLRDMPAVSDACRGVDYVLHQAAIPSVPRSIVDPVTSHLSNVDGTLNVLIGARDASVKRVVYASSSSIYGDTPTLPKHEGMIPNPISPYAVSKLVGEYYLKSFYRVYGLESVSLRYFNVFGPHQDQTSMYSGVLSIWISKMLAGERPVIYGDGEQTRDFTFVENVVSANLLACHASGVVGKCFNVATNQQITLNHAYTMLSKLIGFRGSPIYLNERAGDIRHSFAEIRAAEEQLGYKPSVTFQDGLERTVAWFRDESQLTPTDTTVSSCAIEVSLQSPGCARSSRDIRTH